VKSSPVSREEEEEEENVEVPALPFDKVVFSAAPTTTIFPFERALLQPTLTSLYPSADALGIPGPDFPFLEALELDEGPTPPPLFQKKHLL